MVVKGILRYVKSKTSNKRPSAETDALGGHNRSITPLEVGSGMWLYSRTALRALIFFRAKPRGTAE